MPDDPLAMLWGPPAMPWDKDSQWLLWVRTWYAGPFERIGYWLLCTDLATGDTWREVRPGSLRDRLADIADHLDRRWRMRYARKHRKPSRRWIRETGVRQ